MIKSYISDKGIFYEGQILDKYITEKNNLVFQQKVYIKKFVIHYINDVPTLFFQFKNYKDKSIYTIPVEQLGVLYKKQEF